MTPEQIRVLIAEHEGWKLCDEEIIKPDGTVIDCEFLTEEAVDQSWPDWPNDLNAVHEIVKALPEQESRDYFFRWLPGVVCPDAPEPKCYRLANAAESIQCCEALLRMWGLWKEELDTLKRCQDSGEWPGYPEQIEELEM